MRAMVLEAPDHPLQESRIGKPTPASGQVLLQVSVCGVCRTDLHIADGELPDPKLPLVLGHEIVGRVVETGSGVERFQIGDRVGVPWLGWTCGVCEFCRFGRENLCSRARFTGYLIDGGYAEFTVADGRFCFAIPEAYSDRQAAPLLCAGMIGYRSLIAAGDARRLGIYGFGAAAHIVAQVARHQGRRIFAFTKPDDEHGQAFARSLGAEWAGGSNEDPPEKLDAAIIFAPVGSLVPTALGHCSRGGTVVCAGIHMSAIPSFPYGLLWGERTIRSVANLTRHDGEEFFRIAPGASVETKTQPYALGDANKALADLREGGVTGAAVLLVGDA